MVVTSATTVLALARWSSPELAWGVAGACLVAIAWAHSMFYDRPVLRRLSDGALGESLTAGVARRLRLRGWRSVHHVPFHAFDVDHVIAGPGGVLAIETKYTNEPWDIIDGRLQNYWARCAVDQCRAGARKIEGLLRSVDYGIREDVVPILVIWGPGRPDFDAIIDGVRVIPGPIAARVLRHYDGLVPRMRRDAVIRAVRDFCRVRDAHDARRLA